MEAKPTSANGRAAISSSPTGMHKHILSARLKADGLEPLVESPNSWIIVAIAALLAAGAIGMVALLVLLIR